MEDSDILARLVQWHEASDQATQEARDESERCRDYYDNKQWTEEEVNTLKRRKQPVVTNNRIAPKVDFLKGQEQQRRMMPRAFPRTPAEEEGAEAATDSIRYVLDQAKWDRTRSACFDNLAVEGSCGVDVQVYQKPSGEYCIDPQRIAWNRMWADPHSVQPDYKDAKYKGQFLWMDFDDAVERWSDHRNVLEGMLVSDSSTLGQTYGDVPRFRWADPKRRRIRIAQCWSREEGGRVWFSTYTQGGILERLESPFEDEDGGPDDGFVFGSCFVDRDGNRYGPVKRWLSLQDEINKRRSKALHLLSVRQTYGNNLAGDKTKIRQELARPDGHVEMEGGAKFGEDFGILPTGDLAKGQVDLYQDAKAEIDAVGVNAALSGTEDRAMSGRALIARSEQGLAELQPLFDAHKQFQHDVYRKVWRRIRQFWTDEKWIRVTDDENNVKFVGLNQPMTLGEQLLEEFKKQNPQATPEQMAQAEQQAKMDPAMRQVVGVKNQVAKMDVDLVLDEVPASATLQTEAYEQLMQIAPHAGTMPPPMFEALLEVSPLRNKEKVLKKLRGEEEGAIPPQVQQQMAQMEQAGMQLQETVQELQQKLTDAESKLAEAQALGPAAELAQREASLDWREEALKLREQIASLNLRLQAEKTGRATDKMNNAAADLSAAAADARAAEAETQT